MTTSCKKPMQSNAKGFSSKLSFNSLFDSRGPPEELGEHCYKDQLWKGTGEQRPYCALGNIKKTHFQFLGTGEQVNLFQGNKGTGTPPLLGLALTTFVLRVQKYKYMVLI